MESILTGIVSVIRFYLQTLYTNFFFSKNYTVPDNNEYFCLKLLFQREFERWLFVECSQVLKVIVDFFLLNLTIRIQKQSHDHNQNIYNYKPLVKAGICNLAPRQDRYSSIKNPRSAIITSLG